MGFLEGKRALIVGVASPRSIAWGIAEAMYEQGAELAYTYQNDRLKTRVEKIAGATDSEILIPCDVALDEDIDNADRAVYITPGSPWENSNCESFNGRMRDELLNGKIFYKLIEAQVIIEHWRKHYNTKRPHRSLGSLCFSLRI